MWTSKLVSVEKRDGMVFAKVRHESDGGEPAVEQELFADTLDAEAIRMHATNKAESLERCDASFESAKTLPVGVIQRVVKSGNSGK